MSVPQDRELVSMHMLGPVLWGPLLRHGTVERAKSGGVFDEFFIKVKKQLVT